MTPREIRTRLIRELRRACSMERAAASALDPLVERQPQDGVAALVDAHRTNSHKHRTWLAARLEALGALPPPDGRAGAPILAAASGLARVHPDASEEQRLSQAVLMKQLEVATHDTVERLAKRAGDYATARVARDARRDDEELTRRLLRRRLQARGGGAVAPRIAPAR